MTRKKPTPGNQTEYINPSIYTVLSNHVLTKLKVTLINIIRNTHGIREKNLLKEQGKN